MKERFTRFTGTKALKKEPRKRGLQERRSGGAPIRGPTCILVLGARVVEGAPSGALARRIATAAAVAMRCPDAVVVACGGRAWSGVVEADVIARELTSLGVDPLRIHLERVSLTTVENIREASGILRRCDCDRAVGIVTCDWHLARALLIARAHGMAVVGIPARSPRARTMQRMGRRASELLLRMAFRAGFRA